MFEAMYIDACKVSGPRITITPATCENGHLMAMIDEMTGQHERSSSASGVHRWEDRTNDQYTRLRHTGRMRLSKLDRTDEVTGSSEAQAILVLERVTSPQPWDKGCLAASVAKVISNLDRLRDIRPNGMNETAHRL